MTYTSLAVLAMSASAAISPLSSLVHFHPQVPRVDHRISITLYNRSSAFRDVKIDGHIYTIQHLHKIDVKAPAGTLIYAANRTATRRSGEVLAEITPQLDHQRIEID